MSAEKVELVRRLYELANLRDVDATRELIAPELEMRTAGLFPDVDTAYHGREEFMRFLLDFAGIWVDLSLEPDKYFDLGRRVLVLAHFHATGRDGLEVERSFAHLWTLRDGRAVRLEAYADEHAAFKAAGVSK
jgi:ketosteroid isomerase-like protein